MQTDPTQVDPVRMNPVQVDQATDPASPGRPNEDFVLTTPELMIVLDGASVPPGMVTGCGHGTPWYVQRLGTHIATALAGNDKPLADGLATAISSVNRLHEHECDLIHEGTPSAAVGITRIRSDAIDWLSLADITVAISTPGEPLVHCDNRIEIVCLPEPVALAGRPFGDPEHAAALSALVGDQREKRNRPGGFWVAATNPSAAYEALSGTASRNEVNMVALLSDGATRPVDQMRHRTWPEHLALLQECGPAGLIGWIRELERSDPDGARWPRTKRHDDATVALCRL